MERRRLAGHVQSLWTIAILAIVLTRAAVSGQRTPIGPFDGHEDVGSPKISGSATYNAVSQELALAAGGREHVGPARRISVRLEAHDG